MKRLLLAALIFATGACAALKPIVRTIEDAARILCEGWAAKQPPNALKLDPSDREALSVQEICSVERVIQPFVDEVLAAQRAGARKASMRLKQPLLDGCFTTSSALPPPPPDQSSLAPYIQGDAVPLGAWGDAFGYSPNISNTTIAQDGSSCCMCPGQSNLAACCACR